MNPLLTFPKAYKINDKVDKDSCGKSFPSGSDFAAGIFSVGAITFKNI